MLVLGIETSCDETAVALVREGRLLGEELASQAELHALFGGVVPELASREHLRLVHPLIDNLLRRVGVRSDEVDGVAVARGPGLLGSLLVGMGAAKGFCLATGAPLVGVDHCRAHLLAAGLEGEIAYPALGLLISGGHTQIYHMRSELDFELMGRTLDDAAGEAFDKVAKLLNLPYPGGVQIDRLSRGIEPDRELFPRPYLDNQNLDFSFSGIKTAVANHVAAHPHLRLERMGKGGGLDADGELRKMLASFGWAVTDTLRVKLERALGRLESTRSLVVAGGVAANSTIREMVRRLAADRGLDLCLPEPELCTDNGAMIAHAGSLLLKAGWCHDLDLDAVPRGRAVPRDFRTLRRPGIAERGRV